MKILIFCLVFPALIVLLGAGVKLDAIPSVLAILVGVAGAIFTIMSIWVAFLYPNVLRTLKGENLVNADFSGGGEDTARLKEIVSVIIQSALVMIFSIVALLVFSSLTSFSFKAQGYIAGALQYVVLSISCVQVSALISTILVNFNFISVLERHRRKRAKDHDA